MQLHFLFIPLYFVLNLLMKKSSLSFLTKGSRLLTFSKFVIFISLALCTVKLENSSEFTKMYLQQSLPNILQSAILASYSRYAICISRFASNSCVDVYICYVAFTLLNFFINGQIGQVSYFFHACICIFRVDSISILVVSHSLSQSLIHSDSQESISKKL